MFSRRKKSSKNGAPFILLLACWKRRQFYVVQNDVLDDDSVPTAMTSTPSDKTRPVQNLSSSTSPKKHPAEAYFKNPRPAVEQALSVHKSQSTDSFQASIESMDSLVESYWDPGDDNASQVTAKVSNKKDFLAEHLSFLSAQTQPRKVEEVYAA